MFKKTQTFKVECFVPARVQGLSLDLGLQLVLLVWHQCDPHIRVTETISFNKISVLELPVLRVGWYIFRYSEQIEDQHLYTCIEIIVLHFISHLHDFIEFPVTKTALELYSPLRQACQT